MKEGSEFGTIDGLLRWAASEHPERGIAILERRGEEPLRRTYPELLARARERAQRLARLGTQPGDALLLSLDTSFELLESWFAVVLLGARPVIVAPQGALGSGEQHLDRLESLCALLGARHLVCTDSLAAKARASGRALLAAAALEERQIAAAAPLADGRGLRPEPDDSAFFQLTSGSTGTPRAVAIPHRALLHNASAIVAALSDSLGAPIAERTRTVVSWLPLHHDMGLVGCLLASIRAGLDVLLFPPRLFLARPELWLRALASAGPAVSSAPSFGYQATLEAQAQAEGELSAWHTALVGAEMVRAGALASFAERYASAGFDARALKPCYGLAEATLAVTFDRRGAGVRTRRAPAAAGEKEVACVGSAVLDTEVAIAAPDGRPLPEGSVGEVIVRGPGVFSGYLGDARASAESLRKGWLWTGDLGFLHAGELYVTGRSKEILILRGHNLMPHEIEWLAEAESGGGGTARAAAFSVDTAAEGEAAVLVVEVEGREPAALRALEHAIRARVGRALGIVLADLAFVRRGRIPKTTSGKVRRRELREQYLAQGVERLPIDAG